MKVYIVYNNEFAEGIRGVFAKEEDAKKCIIDNVKQYLHDNDKTTLSDIYRICIQRHDVI